jgi:hypothetical protein
MSDKKPLNEGSTRDITKGSNKPIGSSNVKPTAPPPAPKPKSSNEQV